MNRYTDVDLALTKLLLNRIQARKGMITYGECAAELSSLLGRKVNAHFGLTIPLGHVCDLCYKNGVPFLTALVVYKNDLQHAKTGEGFYKIACEYRKEYISMSPIEAWETEYSKVRKCKDWSSLSAYLERYY